MPLQDDAKELQNSHGLSDDKPAYEIYPVWDGFRTMSYRHIGEGDWTCEAMHKPQELGLNCQPAD